ncbi:MAG: aldo/keto reductase [Phycisphaerae bacterium]|nr:aldo/keto reductase [Phycisphaerae bacterium]
MLTRVLGKDGPLVSTVGLGCMGMSEFYGPSDDAQSIAVIQAYLDAGGNFLDTADIYGMGRNEILVGKAIRDRRDRVFLATKFGNERGPNGEFLAVRGDPKYVKQACEASLKRLGVDHIHLYYQHRVDTHTPIEDTVGAMADLVQAGKVKYLGLSEAGIATIRRAAKIHRISALQSEYSLWTRDPEDGVLDVCRELGLAFVAYSPLGRGFLTGQIKSTEDLAANDHRRNSPRFQAENFQKNLQILQQVTKIAEQKHCTPAQLALAWVLSRGNDVLVIPGTRRLKYLRENMAAVEVQLTAQDIHTLSVAIPKGVTAGLRYPAPMMERLGK